MDELRAGLAARGSIARKSSRGTDVPAENVFLLEGDVWTVAYRGQTFHYRDAKGLRYLARLVGTPNQDFHVLDLAASDGDVDRAAVADNGDAGEVIDVRARDDYRRRLVELKEDLAEAEALNDIGRADALREEIEFLAGELARGVGIGGKSRRAASNVERARWSVTKAIRTSVQTIGRSNPDLGRHLSNGIKTGVVCRYAPELPTAWN